MADDGDEVVEVDDVDGSEVVGLVLDCTTAWLDTGIPSVKLRRMAGADNGLLDCG